jgi:hypothetical protein
MAAPNGRDTAPEGREALIERLEELGYDTLIGTPVNWRDEMSDIDLLTAIKAHAADEAEAGELPDVSEIVEVIRETVNAADAYNAAHPDEPRTPDDATGNRWRAAFDRLRALLTEIDTALEAFS